MNTVHYILILFLGLVYLAFCIRIIRRVFKTNHFTRTQKWVNSALVVLFPFVWGIILLSILKPSYQGTSSPEYRKNKGKAKFKPTEGGFNA